MADESRGTVLVADDSALYRTLLTTSLRESGYTVVTAEDGETALERLAGQRFDVVLLDLVMPGIDGYGVLARMRADASLRHVPVVVVSAEDDVESVVRCLDEGATDHLAKPFNPVLLHARVAACLATKRLYDQQEAHRREIEEHNRRLEERVREQVEQIAESFARLQRALDGTVLALSSALERRDPYTAGHQQRVARLAESIARELGLPASQVEGVRVAGLLHDIGKISVPAEILSKPGRLSEVEFAVVRLHPEVGYEILAPVQFGWPIAAVVRQHQERWNGSGYPAGLAGEAILPEARILGVADVVEAMASHRPYRPALGIASATAEIARHRGVLYEPAVADACLALARRDDFRLE